MRFDTRIRVLVATAVLAAASVDTCRAQAAGPPPVTNPKTDPVTAGDIPDLDLRATVLPAIAALRRDRETELLPGRTTPEGREALAAAASTLVGMVPVTTGDGALLMRVLHEAEATSTALLTLGDRGAAGVPLGAVRSAWAVLQEVVPGNRVAWANTEAVDSKSGLIGSGHGGPHPPTGYTPPPPPPPTEPPGGGEPPPDPNK